MKLRKSFILSLMILICSLYMIVGPAHAFNPEIEENIFIENVYYAQPPVQLCRRGGGFSSGRSGGSRSYRSPTPSRSRNTPSKTITKTKNKNTTRSVKKKTNKKATTVKKTKKTTKKIAKKTAKKSKRKLSKADKKLAEKAKRSGNYHKDRKSATAAFKTKNKGKYKSKYASKPATRPPHIPQTTMVGGVSMNIGYNPMYGGYGHMHMGTWMMYDAMADTIMMNTLMRRQGVFIAGERGTVVVARPYYYSPWSWFFSLIFLCLFIWFIVHLNKNSGTNVPPEN